MKFPHPHRRDLRGTAYGFFNLASGIAVLVASVLAGLLWDRMGASFTFLAGAGFCVLAIIGLMGRIQLFSQGYST